MSFGQIYLSFSKKKIVNKYHYTNCTEQYLHMNFDSFSHGQVESKIWLCETLEPLLPSQPHVYILGGWHNLLGFMLLSRQPRAYAHITSIDCDPEAKTYADKINDCWCYDPETAIVTNITGDANTYEFNDSTAVYINCSPEHINNNLWFEHIPPGAMVCIQSISITESGAPWHISNPNATMDEFLAKYPLDHYLFQDTKRIQYNHWGYDRYMIIGHK